MQNNKEDMANMKNVLLFYEVTGMQIKACRDVKETSESDRGAVRS